MKVDISYKEGREPWMKTEVKLDREDTWSLDLTLAGIIVPCLVQLRDTSHGFPTEFLDEDNEDAGYEKWKECINKMIFSFEQALDQYQQGYEHSNGKDFDKKDFDAYFEKVQDGFSLFGKYYMNLWD